MSRMSNHFDNAPAKSSTSTPMKGFDQEFTDVTDYILRITYRIWEGKQVGLCQDYYSQDCPVYTLAGMTVGADEVTQNTLNTLGAFPDRTLHADNIIWGGNDEDGYHSSHLITTEMTNLGDSDMGPATGKKAKIQVIAHCVLKNNQIVEEWLVRDNYLLAEQLGFDPHKLAAKNAGNATPERFANWMSNELKRLEELPRYQRISPTSQNSADVLCANISNIWNGRMVGDVKQIYSTNAHFHGSAHRELQGHASIEQFYIEFMGTFSDVCVALDYVCSIDNDQGGQDVAIRWTMSGLHTGAKLFGEPTGTKVLIIGESQYRMIHGKIAEEWTVFDQLAIMTQICRARLSAAS